MARRTTCLYNGEVIGIESIFTVVNGRQINIQGKVEDLREKGRAGKLLCPCGCGAKLILVAGEKMLREQHFRLPDGESDVGCRVRQESESSVHARIVLKCWLEDKLKADDLKSRVRLSDLSAGERRFELSFISKEQKMALDYTYVLGNLQPEMLDAVRNCLRDYGVLYIADNRNRPEQGQYPERPMMLQKQQGFCPYLKCDGPGYLDAELTIACYMQEKDGRWTEIVLVEGMLRDYSFSEDRVLLYQGKTIDYWKQEKKAEIRAARRHEQEERNERIQAEKRRQLEIERRKGLQAAAKTEEERRRREEAQKRREAEHEKMRDMDAIFRKNLAEGFVQQEYIVRDAHKRRWARCELCDDIKMETEFAMIGGPGKVNLGICRDCMRRR